MTTRLMVGWQGLRCTVKMAILLSEVDSVSMGLNHLCAHVSMEYGRIKDTIEIRHVSTRISNVQIRGQTIMHAAVEDDEPLAGASGTHVCRLRGYNL